MRNLLFFVALLIFPSVFAGNYSFLNDTPPQYFSNEDWQLFTHSEERALDTYKDGSKLSWKNSVTGHWGYMIPSHTAKTSGAFCRDLTMYNNAEGRTGQSTLKFCKVNDKWKGI